MGTDWRERALNAEGREDMLLEMFLGQLSRDQRRHFCALRNDEGFKKRLGRMVLGFIMEEERRAP